jgi:poly(3-hydroxybutyrate) depolymerase
MRPSLRRLVLRSAFAALLAPHGAALAKSAIVKEVVESGGLKRTCYVYRPEGVPAGTRMPLLVLLHGSGHDGTSLVKEWRDQADSEGILLAGPDALAREGWAFPADGPQFLGDVVAHLEARYAVDTTRIYLFGHSAGAIFALSMAPLESELFAAAALHAGAFADESAKGVLAHARRKVPFFLAVGTADPFFPLRDVREARETLEKAGFPVELWEIPLHDHNYYRKSGLINRKAWEFLSTKRIEGGGTYTSWELR